MSFKVVASPASLLVSVDGLTIGSRLTLPSYCFKYFHLCEDVNAMEAKLAISSILRQNISKTPLDFPFGFHFDPQFVIWSLMYKNSNGEYCKLVIRLFYKLTELNNLALEFEYIEKEENKIPLFIFSQIQNVIGQTSSYATYI